MKSSLQERLPPDSASVSAPDAAAGRATVHPGVGMVEPNMSFLAKDAMVLGDH